jgi:ribonucleoside-triphosphate reductase
MYPDIITQGKEEPYYTNSTQLPVNYTEDIFEALELQDSLQVKYTGGTVLHGFLGEKVTDVESCKKLVKRIAENFRLPYFTITPTFSICPVHGYVSGVHHTCPMEATTEAKND